MNFFLQAIFCRKLSLLCVFSGSLAVKILEQFEEEKDMSLVDVDMVRSLLTFKHPLPSVKAKVCFLPRKQRLRGV